ncbi:MAG: diacylglycerol kinase family lipid kinase [Flavisolibacter sp.]
MQDQKSLILLFIINPVSGGKKKDNWEENILRYFRGSVHVPQFYYLTGNQDKEIVRRKIESIKPDRIISVGGDGTLKMLAEVVIGTNYILGVLAAGSANGMAKELNIPPEIDKALEIIVSGQQKKIDAIKINDKEICIHLSDMGLNAMLVKYFERSGKRGMWGYASSFIRVFWGKKSLYATLTLDRTQIERKAYMIVIANARTYGTGAIINPDGRLDDGQFEIVVIRKLTVWELFKMLITHQPFDSECIEIFKVKTLEIQVKRRTYFQVDGEFLGKTTRVTAQVLPQQINIMLPRAS